MIQQKQQQTKTVKKKTINNLQGRQPTPYLFKKMEDKMEVYFKKNKDFYTIKSQQWIEKH